jgi:hypothetical protein
VLIFKDRSTHYFSALERISHFTILFAFLSRKKEPFSREKSTPQRKKLSAHGVEQAFRLAVRSKEKALPSAAGPRAAEGGAR